MSLRLCCGCLGVRGASWEALLLLLGSSEMSASVALWAPKGSILRHTIITASWCFVVLVDREEGSGNLRVTSEAVLSLCGPKLGFTAC